MTMLPDIPTEDWESYRSDIFKQDTDQRINTLPLHVAPLRDDWMSPGAFAPPDVTAGTETGTESGSLSPSPPTPSPPVDEAQPVAPAVPTPTTDFSTHATSRIAGLGSPGETTPSTTTSPFPSGGGGVSGISGSPELITSALNAADQAGVDPGVFLSLVQQESSFNPAARSPVGAQGLTQLMPDTARGLGVTDSNDPIQSLQGGARYLRQQMDRFGGDVTKALAAYNAGPGAVERYGGIPPYQETQRYVSSIMDRLGNEEVPTATGTAPGAQEALGRVGSGLAEANAGRDISQFGDPQLGTDEAYAACGPAAAVRFAEKFGRNPTLREAVDLAKQVGWTSAQGMAGLGSEQRLMDKLNVPTKLVQGAQWDVFAREAQTGNPVTISTAGHYFTADGYDPTSGAFHVGRSGLDLKSGKEWMTPTQMTALMGQVQGGLLADNPQVPAPSTADQSSNPLDWLGKAKDAIVSGIGDAFGGGQITPLEQRNATSMVGMGSDALTNPLGTGNAPAGGGLPPPDQSQQEQQPQQTVWDQIGTGIASVFRSAFGGNQTIAPDGGGYSAVPPGGINPLDQLPQMAQQGQTNLVARGIDLNAPTAPTPSTDIPSTAQAILGTPEQPSGVSQFLTTGGPAGATSAALRAAGDVVRPFTQNPVDAAQTYTDIQQKYGGGIDPATGKFRAPDYTNITPEDQAALNNATMAVGGLAAPVEYKSVMPAGTFESPTPQTSGVTPGAAIDNVRTKIVRGFFDRQVDINQAQQRYAQALGRPLDADEMAAELQRLSADPAAAVRIDEELRPAIQSVGNDYPALRDYVTLRSNIEVAQGLGNDSRMFSGGLNPAQSQQALTDLENQLGPDRFANIHQAADQVTAFNQSLRQRLVDSGVLSQDQATQMESMYPNWAKTRILDYMADPSGGQGAGTKLGLADRNLRNYTLEGTARAREDPIASTVAYAHQVERMANKNNAFNAMLTIDQASPAPMLRQVPQDFSPTRNQVTMIGFQNGQKVKYVTDNRALGEAINGAGVMSVPEWTSAWQKVFRSLATSRNPVFLAGNAALDIPTYTFRTAIRDGGPQALPGIMADLARGYADAFQGILQGEYRGAGTSAFLKSGGGQSGYFTGGEGQAGQAIADLQRSNVFQINGKSDLLRLAKDLVTLKPVEALGERVELGPRVAAYNRALARGANPVQATIEGRTVTVDFSQGGTVTKYLNNFVPFLNVGFQGPVQIARAWRDNPRAFVATTGTLIGMPTVAAEVWNRADPQRARDYADVPDYVKNQGVVVMLPGQAPTDAQGNRKPLYAVLKLREWAPFAAIAREATARALGDNSRSLAEMAQSIGTGLSPTQSSSAGQLANEALSGIPVVPAAAQLGINKDLFRNRDIVTQRNDLNASAAAKALTPMIQAAVDKLGLSAEIRPSAVDFFIRNQGAGVGGAALGASDIAAGTPRQNTSPTSLPGVGGLAGRFVGDQTGQGLQTARGEILTQSARDILRSNRITTTPGPVGSTANGVPLRLDEEAQYQQFVNRYIDEAIHRAATNPNWSRMPQQGKQNLVDDLVSAARERAAQDVIRSIGGPNEARRRVAAGSSR